MASRVIRGCPPVRPDLFDDATASPYWESQMLRGLVSGSAPDGLFEPDEPASISVVEQEP